MADDAPIQDLNELKQLAGREAGLECFVALNGGFRSSKRIQFWTDDDEWYIVHEIDDSEAEYTSTAAMLENEPIIVEALEVGALHPYPWSARGAEG